jgi:serine/threonine-protein kinase
MQIGPYRIVRKLGEGGMSSVFLTEDARTGGLVALKLLSPRVVADPSHRRRLVREALVIARVRHANVAVIYEADRFRDQPYIAMEYIEGETVADRLRQGPLPVRTAAWIGAETASGLAAAHRAGVVHRDVKPSNVMLAKSGGVKLMDFGLARWDDTAQDAAEGDYGVQHITARGTILGTVDYMSPEQARGERVDHRADIFAAGVLLYEMVAGRAPFRGDHAHVVLRKIIDARPEPLSAARRDVPADLEEVVGRALAKRPEDRFQSASALEVALRSILDEMSAGEGPGASPAQTDAPG